MHRISSTSRIPPMINIFFFSCSLKARSLTTRNFLLPGARSSRCSRTQRTHSIFPSTLVIDCSGTFRPHCSQGVPFSSLSFASSSEHSGHQYPRLSLKRFLPARSLPHMQQTFCAVCAGMTCVPELSLSDLYPGWPKQVQGGPSSVASLAPTIPPQSGHRMSSDMLFDSSPVGAFSPHSQLTTHNVTSHKEASKNQEFKRVKSAALSICAFSSFGAFL